MTDVPFTIRYTKPLTDVPRLRYAIEAAISTTDNPPKTLPAAAKLAKTLGIAPNTAYRSYRLLRDAGLVASAKGAGTAINPYPGDNQDIIDLVQDLVDQSHSEGMELAYLHALLNHLWPIDDEWGNDDPPLAARSIAPTPATSIQEPLTEAPDAPDVHLGDLDDSDEETDFS